MPAAATRARYRERCAAPCASFRVSWSAGSRGRCWEGRTARAIPPTTRWHRRLGGGHPRSELTGEWLDYRPQSTLVGGAPLEPQTAAPQTIAANVDRLLAVGSFAAPPFRPRFLDRLLLCAELGDVQPAVVINKADLGSNPAIEQRLPATGAWAIR